MGRTKQLIIRLRGLVPQFRVYVHNYLCQFFNYVSIFSITCHLSKAEKRMWCFFPTKGVNLARFENQGTKVQLLRNCKLIANFCLTMVTSLPSLSLCLTVYLSLTEHTADTRDQELPRLVFACKTHGLLT